MNLEHFYENLFSTSSHGILYLIRGNSRVVAPSVLIEGKPTNNIDSLNFDLDHTLITVVIFEFDS